MLSNKCKEDFEKWFLLKENHNYRDVFSSLIQIGETITSLFYSLPLSIQYGVYVDFFDNVGIEVNDSVGFYEILNHKTDEFLQFECDIKTRQEARKAAIEKANQIYNIK